MTAAPVHNDANEAERKLHRAIGLVVVCAVVIAIAALTFIFLQAQHQPPVLTVAAFLVLATLGGITAIEVRFRSNRSAFTWINAVALVVLVTLPLPWAILTISGGTLAAKLLHRLDALKLAFAVGKQTITVALTGTILYLLGPVDDPIRDIGQLAFAFAVMTAVDEFLAISVISMASRSRFRVLYLADWDIRWGWTVVRFIVAMLALVVVDWKRELLIGIPPLVLSLHLAHQGKLRARAERRAWQQLAEATDALNVVQLDQVLRTAVTKSGQLFSADQIEVEVWADAPSRLVRGSSSGIAYEGEPDHLAYQPDTTLVVPLGGETENIRIGELRLCFRAPVKLSEREHLTLRTYSGALTTAIRNASTFAQLTALADQHSHDASHDPLTGLPNRRRLQEWAESELAVGKRGVPALILLDLNHFKDINDAMGHHAGDQVLIEIAQRLLIEAGPEAMVARLGGDEFAVFYPALPAPALALHRAGALLGSLREPVDVDGMPLIVSASAGVSTSPSKGGYVELMRRADIAMYQAKRNGSPVTAYARDSDTADRAQLVVAGELPRAVRQKEFTLEFQPIVDLGTGEVISAEALARWKHPDHGAINPRAFLEPIERSGLLTAFTDAVLDQALAAAATWRAAGCMCPVAINISPSSLLDRRLPLLVATRLADHGLPGDAVVLELTESRNLSQHEMVDRVLAELRELGCSLALDDFGTGFSSLSVLDRVPVQEIKIDRSFVSAMEHDQSAAAIVQTTIALANRLNLIAVAEGVETEGQRQALWEFGCRAGQGHLFAKPMPLEQLMKVAMSGSTPVHLAEPMHESGSVLRMSSQRRPGRKPNIGRVSDSSA